MRKFLVLCLLFHENLDAQDFKYISAYHINTDIEAHVNYFKIGNVRASFDNKRNFYIDKFLLFTYPEDSIVTYEVYKKKYLVVSYYHVSEKNSALGPELKAKGRVDIYDLKNPTHKWCFDLKGLYITCNIKKFDAGLGVLTLYTEKISKQTENIYWKGSR